MGWITTHRPKGISDDKWFAEHVLGDNHEIVASGARRSTYYAAVRTIATGEVWGLVILIHRSPRSPHNFGWKTISEDMGPYEDHAPAKVLAALTPTEHEYALEWRARCQANLDRLAAQPRVTAGVKIDMGVDIRFQDQVSGRVFVFVTRSTFLREDGRQVRVTSWKTRYPWKVV